MTDKTNSDQFHFTRETTNHNANPNGETPRLMSQAGQKLAGKTAPRSAYQVATGNTSAIKEK